MVSLIVYLIPYMLGMVLLVAVIGFISNFRRSRSAPYYRLRREATRRGLQWTAIFFAAAVSIVLALLARRTFPPPDFEQLWPDTGPTPLPTLSRDLSPPPLLDTPLPQTDQPLPTNTTPIPPTSATLPIATLAASAQPPNNAIMRITEIASGINSGTPVNASTSFVAGVQEIYFWFDYENMVDGVSWTRSLLLDGEVVLNESEVWGQGEAGTAVSWFKAQGGWPAGQYEIRLYVGDVLVAWATFSIID